jgi:hypothetical protein
MAECGKFRPGLYCNWGPAAGGCNILDTLFSIIDSELAGFLVAESDLISWLEALVFRYLKNVRF